MRLLDLFCGAGGCSVGYYLSGITDITGVDINPQPNYPFAFHRGDALDFLASHGAEFDLIHASPPCQHYSMGSRCRPGLAKSYPDLVDATRGLLIGIGKPYVIENVPNSPLVNPLVLCGTMFDLRVIRHRLFESNVSLSPPNMACNHPPRGTVGRAGIRGKKVGDWISVAGSTDLKVASPAMGIDWMRNRHEIAQAIPPAYTRWIGKQLMDHINLRKGNNQ